MNISLLIYQRLFSILTSGLFLSNTFRWKDGTGTFIEHLTQHLDSPIFPHEPVTSILQSSSSLSTFHRNPYHFKVETPTSTTYCKFVIVATSPSASLHISYSPPLPSPVISANSTLVQWFDASFNIFLEFEHDWLPGLVILPHISTYQSNGLFGAVMNLSHDHQQGIYRIIVDPSRASHLSLDELQIQSLKYLAFWCPDFKDVIYRTFKRMYIKDWSEKKPFIPAVQYYYFPDGSFHTYAKYLRVNHGRIFFAGA